MYEKSKTVMQFDREKWHANRAAYNLKVAERNETPKEFKFDAILKIVRDLEKWKDVSAMLILLQICCGSRIGELIYHSKFEATATPNYVKQIGILKSKTVDDVVKPIIFISVERFLKIFAELRRRLKIDGINSAETMHGVYQAATRATKKLFRDTNMSSHDLRKIYAELSYVAFSKQQKRTAWISKVLGHDMKSVGVSTSYMTVNVSDVDVKKLVADAPPPKKRDAPHNMADAPHNMADAPHNMADAPHNMAAVPHNLKAALRANGKKITFRLLKSYGFGSGAVSQYFKGHM
jgi:integrase